MPWPTVMAALALYLTHTHTHTQHRTQRHVLTVAVIVISFVLYECVGLCVCVSVWVRESDVLCGFVSVVALTFDETKVTFV